MSKEVEVRFIPSEEQIADVCTKALNNSMFEYFRDKLILDKSKFSLRGDVNSVVKEVRQVS